MDKVFLRYVPLPYKTKGLTVQDAEGDYNIYINSHLSNESHFQTLQHEIQHIDNKDFQKQLHIKDIEKR